MDEIIMKKETRKPIRKPEAAPRPKQRTTRPARPARSAAAPTVKERDISDLLAKHECGKREVHTPSGYIDVLTDKHVYEVKIASKWKAAMGQVLAYKTYYPRHKPRLYLYGKPTMSEELIEKQCKRHGIVVVWHHRKYGKPPQKLLPTLGKLLKKVFG
jgi:hypothetical protein